MGFMKKLFGKRKGEKRGPEHGRAEGPAVLGANAPDVLPFASGLKDGGPLDGYWEEGYHYYFEIRGDRITVRDASKRVCLERNVSYDPDAVRRGEGTGILVPDAVISRAYDGSPMVYMTSLRFEDGEIRMGRYFTVTREAQRYSLHRAEHDPFWNILILDEDELPLISGDWVDALRPDSVLRVEGDEASFFYAGMPTYGPVRVHVTAHRGQQPPVKKLTEADLTSSGIGEYSDLEIRDGMLCGYRSVTDVSVPLTCFVRPEDVGKKELPEQAYAPVEDTMTAQGDW